MGSTLREEQEEEVPSASNIIGDDDSPMDNGELVHSAIVKGKRTKRQWSQPTVLSLAIGASAPNSSSSATSSDANAPTEEEEDMAHCLILLSQGSAFGHPKIEPIHAGPEKFVSRRFSEAATNTNGKYECKTCSKCFPSFQALGGHRTSHKKPKLGAATPEQRPVAGGDFVQLNTNSFARPVASSKGKVHECAICGSEFSSGQALGGHMRRHRPLSAAGDAQESNKDKHFLSLDLNLPASPVAEEPRRPPSSPSFSLGSKQSSRRRWRLTASTDTQLLKLLIQVD